MNIHEAKTHLSRLVDKAAAGEEIIIAKAGKPMAKLVPYHPPVAPRVGGFLAGKISETPDAWAPDEELAAVMTEGTLFAVANPVAKVAEEKAVYQPKVRKKGGV
ncbi:MAG: type II toxin-antitoxin system prevent-host-death family antitoxin [Verrucomicrobiota bacterium]